MHNAGTALGTDLKASLADLQFNGRTLLMAAMMLVLLPTIGISGWLSYRHVQETSERNMAAQATDVGLRVQARVSDFFNVPWRITSLNAARFRAGLLNPQQPELAIREFYFQIREQPELSFVSMALINGEYYAGTRTAVGPDVDLHLMHARIADGRHMKLFRTDDAGHRARLEATGTETYDVRQRPWFKNTLRKGQQAWTPAYRYTKDFDVEPYGLMGIAVTAPLIDQNGAKVGVIGADVALAHLGDFLKNISATSGAVMFVADSGGQLLATSTADPIYLDDVAQAGRLTALTSSNPLIRTGGALIQKDEAEGSVATEINGTPHFVTWRIHTLPQGDRLTIGVIFSQAQFERTSQAMLRNIVYLTMAAVFVSFLLSVMAANWVSRPLAALSRASGRFATGNWRATRGNPSPVREVATLFVAMDRMAEQLKLHTEGLEQLVTLRTAELKVANDKLREETATAEAARHIAEDATRAKSKFLAAASHDLRQPAQAQGLFLEVLSRTALNAEQHKLLDNVRAASAASADMLNTLLDFSRIEAGVISPRLRHFAVQTLFNKMEQEFGPQADASELLYRSRETALVAHSDPALVELILRNLVSNALRYTRHGGVLVACRKRGALVALEVWDTGIGIAVEQQQEVFREFLQLGNPERDRQKGLGLGLAIANGLAQRLGHTLTLHSREGRGSVFRLALPLGTALPSAAPASTDNLSLPRQARVLVIDDDDAVRSALQRLLRDWGCQCDAAATIEEALALARLNAPAAVISDYRLRGTETGADAIKALRTLLGQSLPALLITGDTAPERLVEASQSGLPLLHKPVAAAELKRHLQSLLEPVARKL